MFVTHYFTQKFNLNFLQLQPICGKVVREYQERIEAVQDKNELRQFRIKRKKRQAVPATKLRLRKELRMMSDAEIQLFFDAVNSAKANTVSFVLC